MAAKKGRVSWHTLAARLLLLAATSYGQLYFSYKFLVTSAATSDFAQYYQIYRSPLNFHVAVAPFCLRQVSAALTFLVWKSHLFYPNQIQFVNSAFDQRIFFAALLTNWVCLILTAVVAGLLAEDLLGEVNTLAAILAGFLCMLSFHTQFVVITGLTEGPSWLLFALAMLAYRRRNKRSLLTALAVAIFQRETILLAFAVIATLSVVSELQKRKGALPRLQMNSFPLQTGLWATLFFLFYLGLRASVPGYEHQTHLTAIGASLKEISWDGNLLFQGVLTQNVAIIAVFAGFSARRSLQGALRWLGTLVVVLIALDSAGLAAGTGNNIGRISGILTPAFAALAAACLLSTQRESLRDGQ